MTISRRHAAAPLLALTLALGLGACGTDTDTEGSAPSTSEDATPTSGDAAPTTGDTAPTTDDTEPSTDAPTTEEPTMTPTDPADNVALPTGPVTEEVIAKDTVQAAIADLAERQSVAPDAVSVAGYHSVTWNDGSLGCPEPGMMYTMALEPGHLLVLEVDGELFSYHSRDRDPNGGDFSYCANPKIPKDLGAGGGHTM